MLPTKPTMFRIISFHTHTFHSHPLSPALYFLQENANLDPDDSETKKKIGVAYKGLEQLRMYDEYTLSGGNPSNPNWSVTLEQNPMPKPPS